MAPEFPMAAKPRLERASTEQSGRTGTRAAVVARQVLHERRVSHRVGCRWHAALVLQAAAAGWLGQHVELWYITRSTKLEGLLSRVQLDINAFAFTTHNKCLCVLGFFLYNDTLQLQLDSL